MNRKKVLMVSKSARGISFLVLSIALFLIPSCAGNSPTPPPTQAAPTATATFSPTNPPTATAFSTPTPDEAATLHAIETTSVKTLISTVHPVVLAAYPSPNGKWQVEVIRYDCIHFSVERIIAYEQLKLINLMDGTEQTVDDQLQNCDGVGAAGFEGLYWSPSNRYFYYLDSRAGFPEGVCGDYYALPIYRLNPMTSETLMVGGGHLSPDRTKLAMWDWQTNEIVFWDLDQGEIARILPLKPELAKGGIRWSLDSKAVIYIQTESECAPNYGRTYITRLDLTDHSQSLLVEYPAPSNDVVITPVPSGIFTLLLYTPLIMNYDPSVWRDESQYADSRLMPVYFVTNYLQALRLESCKIGQQGPMGDIPGTSEAVRLGAVRYNIVTSTDSPDSVLAFYIENQSLTEFNYDNGTAVLAVEASQAEWAECKNMAEKVLATLHVP